MSVEVRIDQGPLTRLLRMRGGRVERRLRERTERVAKIAERESPGSMGRYISWKIENKPGGLQGVIVCDHRAVRYVLDGTRPHTHPPPAREDPPLRRWRPDRIRSCRTAPRHPAE
ncbi:hypothetical protein AB5J72_10180 [Streptomyces sp. CG1]|uniref:hypothetical protein n=1 Tax=Streptomyces sp. CG1 TaxID=1287523 RepID=UPI0034E2F3AB